jgi:two-component system sensor histidine kinase KdpD
VRSVQRGALLRFLAVAGASLALATIVVAVLQDVLGVPNPSAVYLVAVVATAIASGTAGAIVAAVASFLLYNFLFTEPRYTLSMHEPGVWLSVVLLLFVGVVVGQLAALQRSRAEIAERREREARALFSVSRLLVTRESVEPVLAEIARLLEHDAGMHQILITIGMHEPASSQHGVMNQLRRMPGDTPPQWVRVHHSSGRPRVASEDELYRVTIESAGATLGSILAIRTKADGPPDREQTRLLAATADQLGQAIDHDRMARESHAAELARESDELKSALLQSVSHDLRTPLATIRAAAGTLRPAPDGAQGDLKTQRDSVDAIEREVEYLNRLVSNLLDLSRIEAGAVRPALDAFELDDLVGSTLTRVSSRLEDRPLEAAVSPTAVEVDPVFFEAVLTNVLENAARHTEPGTSIRVSSTVGPSDLVRLTVEDSGQGVPDDVVGRLFDKFYRVPGRRASRTGTGIGLAVARGLVEAMGGHIGARRSDLGGLAIDVDLRAARLPADIAPAAPAAAAPS